MRNVIWISILAISLLFSAASPTPVLAQDSTNDCGDTYIVQRRDILSRIANFCGVSYAALLNANPQITNPNLIYPGQVINIPSGDDGGAGPIPVTGGSFYIVKSGDTLRNIASRFSISLTALLNANPDYNQFDQVQEGDRLLLPAGAARIPTITATPGRGTIGTPVTIGVTGFTSNTEILIGIGKVGGPYYQLDRAVTNANGALYRVYQIPSWVDLTGTQAHVFVAQNADNANIRALSNNMSLRSRNVVGQPGIPVTGPGEYVVRGGDTLANIADRFGVSFELLLDANPQIEDPTLIYPGQVINLPASARPSNPWVGVSDRLVFPGQTIRVRAMNFPPNAYVDIRLAPLGQDYIAVVDGITNSSGDLLADITVPLTAQAGERWEAIVTTTERAEIVRDSSRPIRIYE